MSYDSGHFRKLCTFCATMISQCRCPGPRSIVRGVCSKCYAKQRTKEDMRPLTDAQLEQASTGSAGAELPLSERLTPKALVALFVKEQPISFEEAFNSTPNEHMVEFETWRRRRDKGDKSRGLGGS